MRQLKYHEKKLLKKVDFFSWKSDKNVREAKIIRKYLLQEREDYIKYNKIAGNITKLVAKLRVMPQTSSIRNTLAEQILQKLYNMGIIDKASSLTSIESLSVSSFCRQCISFLLHIVRINK